MSLTPEQLAANRAEFDARLAENSRLGDEREEVAVDPQEKAKQDRAREEERFRHHVLGPLMHGY